MPTNSLGKSSELKLHCFAYLMPTACLKICAVPRLIAWNTKNPMQGNHWVPLGCRALPGSVEKLNYSIAKDYALEAFFVNIGP